MLDYSDRTMWVCREDGESDKRADVFFVCPTVYLGSETEFIWETFDEEYLFFYRKAVENEKGIYSDDCRFFAPLYRQASLSAYDLPPEETDLWVRQAYRDIRKAFEYYLNEINGGRPLILAGFSQGADICLRLLKDYFADSELRSRLIACYAIGWPVTEEYLESCPFLRFAEAADDTGVIISFDAEAPEAEESIIIPKGVKTLAINPLNWRTDSTPAPKELNRKARLYDLFGNLICEKYAYTGAYIDPVRGVLKVTDVPEEDCPPALSFKKGVYHMYDYQFFYYDLKANVRLRIASFFDEF